MVHSGSASPMTTPPSASPHLTIPATAPPLQAPPLLVPPPADTTDQDLSQTPAKLLTPDLSTSSGSPAPVEIDPPALTPVKPLNTNSGPASAWSSTKTPTPVRATVNGRTSGRKRTPKACDCCGPHSTGHNVKTSSRGGRGRGTPRGRGRGAGRDHGHTPKRNVGGHLPHINSFELTKEKEQEAEDQDGRHRKVQTTVPVNMADSDSQIPVDLPVTASLEDGPRRNCITPGKGGMQKSVVVAQQHVCAGARGKAGGIPVGIARARGGKEVTGDTFASEMEMKIGLKREGGGCGVISLETDPSAMPGLSQVEKKVPEMAYGEHINSGLAKSPFGNGDMVEPSGAGTEGKEVTALSDSGLSDHSSKSETPLDLDLEMQVDQTPDRTDSVSISVTLSNGSISTPTDHEHTSTPMELDTVRPAVPSPPQDPITVCTTEHHWALRDHRLYCQPGTWEKDNDQVEGGLQKEQSEEGGGQQMDGKMQDEESLTEMIHEFLESFYEKYGSFIPLSEADVLEYLKKKGNCDLSNSGLDILGEVRRYRAGLASAPVACFNLMYNKHILSLEDLGTLEEQNWLNDQVINMYGELIMEATQHKVHFFNSFFHKQLVAKGYEGVKRWTKKVDLFSKWLLLVPIHLEIHWSLITVSMANKTISYYDSQGITIRHTIDNIMRYLQSEAREKKQTTYQKGWKMHIIKGIPQQKNDSDCGVFVLEYCRRLSVKQPLQFSQDDMPDIRKRIYKELCDCRLNN